MAEKVLKWGLLSTARINRALIPVLKSSKRNELAAVGSRDSGKAQAYAREWGIPKAVGTYEALLSDPEIDVIYNPLPNSLHAEWSIKALEAGKHVLCEKPLAMSAAEVDAMTQAAQENKRVLAEALMYRHHPQTRRIKELVDTGRLGKLRMIKGGFTFNLNRPEDVRLKAELGGGSVWDLGSYPISFARLMAGAEPVEVFGWQELQGGVDVTFAGQVRFPDGLIAQFDCGFRTQQRQYMELAGSEGALSITTPFKPGLDEKLEIHRGDEIEPVIIRGQQLYEGEVEDMADAVLKGQATRVSLADSRGTVATIEALLRSARTGRPEIL